MITQKGRGQDGVSIMIGDALMKEYRLCYGDRVTVSHNGTMLLISRVIGVGSSDGVMVRHSSNHASKMVGKTGKGVVVLSASEYTQIIKPLIKKNPCVVDGVVCEEGILLDLK